jgi:hypothetical protein
MHAAIHTKARSNNARGDPHQSPLEHHARRKTPKPTRKHTRPFYALRCKEEK